MIIDNMEETKVTEAEQMFCLYKLGLEGSFVTALIDAIFKADTFNRIKISLGFPDIVEVCNRYNHEKDYWQNLVTKWNNQNQGHHKLYA